MIDREESANKSSDKPPMVLTQPPAFGAFLLFCAGVIVTFILWASFFEINDYVRGYGRVIPYGQTRLVQHLEGGIIEEILVREGQEVSEGTPLMRIKNTTAQADLAESRIQLFSFQAKQARLAAELEEREAVVFPADLEKAVPEIVAGEQALFSARQKEFFEKINGLMAQEEQKRLKLEELATQIDNLGRELKIARDKLDIIQRLNQSGAASDTRLLEAKAAVSSFQTLIDQARKQVPIVEAQRLEVQSLLEETREKNRSAIFEELAEVKVRQQQLTERLKSFGDRIDRTQIISPVNGIVNKLHNHTIGGVVRPGDVVVEIIPTNETLIIEAQIATNDREEIWSGLPVKIRINAYDTKEAGVLSGVLQDISADSFEDKQGHDFYRIRVVFDLSETAGLKIFPGMTAEVNIVTGRRTIMNYILKPLRFIKDEAFGI